MSWEDRVSGVKAGGNNLPKLADGEYVLAVDLVKEVINTGGKRGQYWINEWVVLQSSHPAHAPGSRACMVIRMDVTYPDTPIGEVKGFTACLFGLDPTSSDPAMAARVDREITPDVVRGIKRPENPMRGSVVAATVYTTQGEKPFQGKYRFRAVIENGQPKRVALPARAQETAPAPMPPGYGQPYPGAPPQQAPWSPPVGPPGPPMAPPGYGQPPAPPGYGQPYPPGPPQAPAAPMTPAWVPPAPQQPPVPFPPPGWLAHPTSPGYFYKGETVLTEAQVRAVMAAGQA